MAVRNSEYNRNENDFYETPPHVTAALLPFLGRGKHVIWEPCAGAGRMSEVLEAAGHRVYSTDIAPPPLLTGPDYVGLRAMQIGAPGNPIGERDFTYDPPIDEPFDGIVTNPPFGRMGPKFLRRALDLTEGQRGFVAMLFPMEFDAAPGRADLFAKHFAFDKKIVLTKRIVWMEPTEGTRAQPSMHHAWYLWDWARTGGPATAHWV